MPMLSILGLYNYDPSIFDGFRVPETLNKQTVINELCLQLAELSLVYPSPSTMRSAITIWTDIHYKEWCDLEETLYYEYNPIWNVDGTVVEERDLTNTHTKTGSDSVQDSGKDILQASGSDSIENSGSDTVTNSGSDTVTNSGTDTSTNSGSDTTTRSVVGYNSTSFADAEKTQLQHGLQNTLVHGLQTTTLHGLKTETEYGGASETTYGRKDETTFGKKSETTYDTEDKIHDAGTVTTTRTGNIGVTKTQELIESQREIVQFNVTDFIIRQFKRKFCVMVY